MAVQSENFPHPVSEPSPIKNTGRPGDPDVFDSIASVEALRSAWEAVQDSRDGDTPSAVQEELGYYADDVAKALRARLLSGKYRAHSSTEGESSQPGEHDPPHAHLLDRTVERSLVNAIAHRIDVIQASCSFAHRPGLGPDDAVEHLIALRDAGAEYAMVASINPPTANELTHSALAVLTEIISSPRTHALIRELSAATHPPPGHAQNTMGAPTRPHLTQLLENLALTPVDRGMCDAGVGYVRYARSIAICGADETELRETTVQLKRLLAEQGHQIEQDSIAMATFDEGFCYLGTDFTAHTPEAGSRCRRHDPEPDRVVYVGRNGSRVHVRDGRVVVDGSGGIPQMSIPQRAVSRMVLNGNVGLSAGARSWALANAVDVVFLSWRGGYLGQLAGSHSAANARRLLTQAALAQDERRRLPLARAIVSAKIRNQIHVLHRTGTRAGDAHVAAVCRSLRTIVKEISYVLTTDELMGLEGTASNEYFSCLARLVPDDVYFPSRSRRPPRDLANAAFSYGYAILQGETLGALHGAGLEPSLGILHASTDKRPSLALDLMEEFRPLLVDRTVVALLRTRRLRPEHAAVHNDGVWLSGEGKKILVDGYEETLQRHVKGALPGFAGTWRRHIHHEAQLLARAIVEPDYEWAGVSWR